MKIIKSDLKWKIKESNFLPNNPGRIIIHHALKDECSIFDVHNWHLGFGWWGCGYHYFVRKNGDIYKGREEHWNGGHVAEGDINYRSLGICVEGCYEQWKGMLDAEMPKEQFRAMTWLIHSHIMPRYPNITIDRVEPHRKYANYKKCPGDFLPWDNLILTLKVMDFQEKNNLIPDGIAGFKTVEKMLEVISEYENKSVPAKTDTTVSHEKISKTHIVKVRPMDMRALLINSAGKDLTMKNFVSGNFFYGRDVVGWLASGGKILADRLTPAPWDKPKGTYIVYRDGSVFVGLRTDAEMETQRDRIWFCCQGINLFPVDLKKEGYSIQREGRKTDSISMGYDGTYVVIAYRPDSDAHRAARTLKNLKCSRGIRLDGGGSANLVVRGRKIHTTDRVLPCVLTW